MKNLNLDYLKSLDIDYSKVVNHTFDVVEGSILCINHDDNNKLNEDTKMKIINVTAKYDHNFIRGRRDAIHFVGFIINLMKIIKEQTINEPPVKQLLNYY